MLEIDYDKIPYNKKSWSGERSRRNSFCETTIEDASFMYIDGVPYYRATTNNYNPGGYVIPSKEEFALNRENKRDSVLLNENGKRLRDIILSHQYGREDNWFLDEVKLLLLNGAFSFCLDEYGNSPLMLCIKNDFFRSFEMLINAGADINHVNNNGDTPFIYSVIYDSDRRFFDKLLSEGCDIDISNNQGYTGLLIANERNNGYMVNSINKHRCLVRK